MVNYRRSPFLSGTLFFTVALADRRSTHPTAQIATLPQSRRRKIVDR